MINEPFTSWLIELYNPKMEQPLQVILNHRMIVGRNDPTGENPNPDVDLTPYGAAEQGVSRQHVALFEEHNRLKICDLNSGNGTLLNGQRLTPDQSYTLQHEDHLQLGHMRVDIRIIISPSYGSTMHKQTSLQLQDKVHSGKGQTIQIVEDDEATAKLLTIIMQRAGYKVEHNIDVLQAIRTFNQHKPSAIILDMMLPGMDGLEFCRYVRRDVKRNTTPIVAVSANSTRDMMEQALAAHADIFLGKPINAKELTHVISSLINYQESGVSTLQTKHLVGTAPLKRIAPETQHVAAVLFVAGHNDAPVIVNLKKPASFGRLADKKSDNHVDLSKFGAVDQGVSRVHMFLHHKDSTFYIEDNHSVNGTFINGEPSKGGEHTPLKNGDEIRLGTLRMYIYFLTDEERAGQAPK